MICKVILVGRVGSAPDIRTISKDGRKAAQFSLATSEKHQDRSGEWQEATEWHNVVCFDKTAETCETYLSKGMLIYVEGKLRTREWADRNGDKRRTTEVVASTVRFLDRKEGAGRKAAQSAQDESEDLPF